MVPLQYFLQCRSVFGCVGADCCAQHQHVVVERLLGCSPEQAVAGGQVRSVADVLFDAGIACCVQGGDEQAEPGDGDGEWVDVDAVDAVECFVDQFASAEAGRVLLPSFVQTVERSEKEMP